ncbi:hypothetical protein MPOCJGCO_3455 [Methylobacterium trifolii]|uniref:Uncharacterized protein n=1 Tax=Methylobacterium trifolii TaxID=1003092 RepID=A0ABQ4U1H2_9HYPH|nr:hypothetical protein MPOCJGCO_3455 [Methylobacterium trifolii]
MALVVAPRLPPPVRAPSVAVTVSSGSNTVSGRLVTVKLALVAPTAKVTAPLFRPETV